MKHTAPTIWVIERDEVERGDVARTASFLKGLTADLAIARSYEESIDLAFSGYDDDGRALYEIPEVRDFVQRLDQDFPFWFFFLSKSGGGLAVVALSFLPPYLTDEARIREHRRRLLEIIEGRWGPALNHLVASLDLPESRADLLLTRSVSSIVNRRVVPEGAN